MSTAKGQGNTLWIAIVAALAIAALILLVLLNVRLPGTNPSKPGNTANTPGVVGITRIDRWASMSDMKHGALVDAGIEVIERVPIPDALIPADARVEMDAKRAAGYFSNYMPDEKELAEAKGRGLDQ